ncbi:hypothetical protein BD769DRAFT_1457615, partial [Suillus cothurnatus]
MAARVGTCANASLLAAQLLRVHANAGAGTQGAAGLGHWDEGVLEIVGGSREEGWRIRTWLGDVEVAGGRKAAHISRYLCERYGFESGEIY